MRNAVARTPYRSTYLPDGRKARDLSRIENDVQDERDAIAARLRAERPDWDDETVRRAAVDAWWEEERNGESWLEWRQRQGR